MRQRRDLRGRYKNKRKSLRNALAGFCAVVWIVNGIEMYFSEPVVWRYENPISVKPAEASDQQTPDPCGLEVVVCPGEENEPDVPVLSDRADVVAMIRDTFPKDSDRSVRIFHCESGLDPAKHSEVDVMRDGRAFSVGLAQINLTVTPVDGLDCPKAFAGINKNARVVDEKLYRQCVKRAENPSVSLAIARQKYETRDETFGAWAWCSAHN